MYVRQTQEKNEENVLFNFIYTFNVSVADSILFPLSSGVYFPNF